MLGPVLVSLWLIAGSLAGVTHAQDRTRITPLFTIEYPPPAIAGADHGGVVFSGQHAFFGTDGGIFRAPLPLGTGTAERVGFESTPVTGLAWSGTALYVSPDVGRPAGPGAATRSLWRSTDEGATWTPIDDQLEECIGASCARLVSSQIATSQGRLFVNAGGNVLVSADEGNSWSILFGASSTGKPQGQACYDPAFALVGTRLLLGGECPLDMAYLRTGTLQPDLLHWLDGPETALTPPLENRNVQFIRRRGETDVVFAGIEGGLLRSDDAGATYRFVLHFEGNAPKYPYITQIAFPRASLDTIIIGGFDKARGGPFLAVSNDDGETWRDDSHLLPGAGDANWSIGSLHESPDGRIVITVEDDHLGRLYVSELSQAPGRRRAIRH